MDFSIVSLKFLEIIKKPYTFLEADKYSSSENLWRPDFKIGPGGFVQIIDGYAVNL